MYPLFRANSFSLKKSAKSLAKIGFLRYHLDVRGGNLWEDVVVGRSVVRGIRGAINVEQNSETEIISATRELLLRMVAANNVRKEDIASIFFTLTPDLNAAFPAAAARELGWSDVSLLGAVEVDVPGAMPFCIRVLMHINTELGLPEIKHLYLRETRKLRTDLFADNT